MTRMTGNQQFKAILTTTIMPVDGLYDVRTLEKRPTSLAGVQHYIGHPSTRLIVESLGADKASSNLFKGLDVGEIALVCSIKQGRSKRSEEGKTVDQNVSIDDISFRIIRRIT
jgi:hypothetical protein